jgi:hypothetical protein
MSTSNPVSTMPQRAIERSSLPISFSLLNDDDQPVLDILDDSEGQDLRLKITNRSRRTLKLADLAADKATPEKHHFELRFRPGILNTGFAWKVPLSRDFPYRLKFCVKSRFNP